MENEMGTAVRWLHRQHALAVLLSNAPEPAASQKIFLKVI